MDFLLDLHNINRWLFLAFGLYAITKASLGIIKNQEYGKTHNLSAVLFIAVTHLQALIGLILYFGRGWHNFIPQLGEYMKQTSIRFWTIEHIFGMLVAVVLIQMGRTKSKKESESRNKFKISLWYFSIAMLIVLATIPWPFRGEVARALWP